MGVGVCPYCNLGVTSDANISGTVVGDEVEDFPWVEQHSASESEGASDHPSLSRLLICTWRLHCDDSVGENLLY